MARKLLRQFRRDLGLSYEKIAKRIGISKAHYANIEAGVFDPSYKTLEAFERAFKKELTLYPDLWSMFQKDDKLSKVMTVKVKKDPTFVEEVEVKIS